MLSRRHKRSVPVTNLRIQLSSLRPLTMRLTVECSVYFVFYAYILNQVENVFLHSFRKWQRVGLGFLVVVVRSFVFVFP